MTQHAVLTGTDLVTSVLERLALLVGDSIVDTETWGGCVGWSWCGVDSWTWARGQDRERGGVAAVRLLTTWVGWIIDHYTAGWQVGVPWTYFCADISSCHAILTLTVVITTIPPFHSLAVGLALVDTHVWLRGRWHGWLLSSLHSWGWSIVRIGRWDHVRRIGASWIWCWIWIRIRIGIGIGIWVWIRVWRWSVVGSWCQCWIGASDTASYSRWLVRIGLVTLWDLATFGIIGIWDHDTAGGNVRILSTS